MNKELVNRFLTALVAGTIAMGAIIYAPGGLWLFCVVVSQVGIWEFWKLMGITDRRYTWTSWLWGLAGWGLLAAWRVFGIDGEGQAWLWAWGLLLFPMMALIALFNPKEKDPLRTLSFIGFSYWYAYVPLVLFFLFSVPGPALWYKYQMPLGILLLTWFLDSAAYFIGKGFGRHPLFPRISPKKTWEGSLGAAVVCMGIGVIFQNFWALPGVNWIIIAGIISTASQLGDLVESMFKRSVHLKDSGSILPGHGGMLDRFDGLFLSVPFIQLYFILT
jgi:phosphatidate cytidylyltransferase